MVGTLRMENFLCEFNSSGGVWREEKEADGILKFAVSSSGFSV